MTKEEFLQQLQTNPAKENFLKALDVATGIEQPKQNYGMFKFDISNPRGEGALEKFGKGALIGLRQGGLGLKSNFMDLTPEDIAELDRMKAYQEQAGLPATLGNITEQMPQYYAVGKFAPGAGLGGIATRAGLSGMVGGYLAPENKMQEAGLSAAGSAVGEGLLGMARKALKGPVAKEEVKDLYESGVRPTLAQALGGGWKTAEEKLTSIPLVGSAIERAQKRSLESFNTASLKQVIDELNTGLKLTSQGKDLIPEGANALRQAFTDIGNIEPGAKGIEKVYNAVGKVYDDLAKNSSGEITPQLQDSLMQLREMTGQISPEAQKLFDAHLKDSVLSRVKPGERIPGETFKQIDTDLDQLIANLSNPNKSSTDNMLGKAFMQVKEELTNMMDQQNPGYGDILRNADAAYRKLALLGKASTSSVSNELATPANLLQQLRAEDTSKWKKNFATNKSEWIDWARKNLDVMGNKFPESGTAARSALSDLFGTGLAYQLGHLPEAMATYAAARAAWSPAVQDFLVEQAIKQPGPVRANALKKLSKLRVPASTAGAAYTTGRE